MEKLIELLNEYNIELHGVDRTYKDGFDLGYEQEYMRDFRVAYLISKSFGFIKWLVDNDKIDFDKCGLDIKDYLSYSKRYDKGIVMAENYDNDTFVVREFYSPYEQLLMLLSIQDNPIELLISVLK